MVSLRDFLTEFVLKAISENSIFESLSKDMGDNGSFFVRYMMQAVFLVNIIYLFDISHFIVKTVKRLCRKYKDEPFVDQWYFDLGYFQAYTLTLFFLAYLFSVVIPLISFFAFLFFFFRFYFEKY